MATERVQFAKNFNYTWPSRAVTSFKAGYEGPVKVEIVAAARKKGGVLNESNVIPSTRAGLEKLATAEGVDLAAIEGTGAKGYVTNADVEAAIFANRAARIAGDEPGAAIGSGGPSGAEAPTE